MQNPCTAIHCSFSDSLPMAHLDSTRHLEQTANMRPHRVDHLPDIIEELDYALGVALVGRWTGIEISLRRQRFDELQHYSGKKYNQSYRGFPVRLINHPNPGSGDRVSGFIGSAAQCESLPPYEADTVPIPQIRMEDLGKMGRGQ